MALVRWEPVRELTTLQNEMNRLFSTFFDNPAGGGGANGGGLRRWVPAMDLVETEDHFVLKADLPGLDAGDVNIEVEDNVLTVSGERKVEHETSKEGFYRLPRASGGVPPSPAPPPGGGGESRGPRPPPGGAGAEKIGASFNRGALETRAPSPERRKPRRVQMGGGGENPAIGGGVSKGFGRARGAACECAGRRPPRAR